MGIQDIVSSVRDQLRERVTSPLAGAFILSWLAFNHNYLIILLADEPVAERIALASTIHFANTNEILVRGIAYPGLSAMAFILTYPHVALFFFRYWRKEQAKQLKAKREIDGAQLMSKSEAERILAEVDEEAEKHKRETERKDARINMLIEQKAALEAERDKAKMRPGRIKVSDPKGTPLELDAENKEIFLDQLAQEKEAVERRQKGLLPNEGAKTILSRALKNFEIPEGELMLENAEGVLELLRLLAYNDRLGPKLIASKFEISSIRQKHLIRELTERKMLSYISRGPEAGSYERLTNAENLIIYLGFDKPEPRTDPSLKTTND